MLKKTLTAAALAAVLAGPALAQNAPMNQSNDATHMNSSSAMKTDQQAGFVQNQSASEWRASKVIGASVYGPDNKSIGAINDVILASDGSVKAVVVGVGGFLGVGEKNVAIPFQALNVTRKANSATIDKITVSYNKQELQNAPKFAFYQANGSSTTGEDTSRTAPSTTAPAKGMNR